LFRDASTDIDWIITLAGRVGFTFDRSLIYAKAGVAWADESFSHTGGSNTVRFFTGDNTAIGWLIGAGLEYAMDRNWSVKAEYDYIDFGEERVSLTEPGRTAIFDIDQDVHMLKIGLNYRFDTVSRVRSISTSEPLLRSSESSRLEDRDHRISACPDLEAALPATARYSQRCPSCCSN
jgi:outer membrane immunogenic protein